MSARPTREEPVQADQVTCCIAGCGPAGAMLGLLLARAGIDVLVLEKYEDFLRDVRGDTIHPSTLEVIDELGLLEAFSTIPQQRVSKLEIVTDSATVTAADFGKLDVRHPYIAFVPQWDFLDFITDEARRYPTFELRMGAEVLDVTRRGGRVTGVRYRSPDGVHEVAATLTVATDGRASDVRHSVGLEPVAYGAPMDVLWFRLSRRPSDANGLFGRVTSGRFAAMIDRGDYWQVAFGIPKGTDAALRSGRIEGLRDSLTSMMPWLADRVGELRGWEDVRSLEVQVNRLRRWHLPGLLLIGDAAHAMSPVGGVGINLAIQDAVATANLLVGPLTRGAVTERDLRRVQRRRWLPTAVTQLFQRAVQRRLVAPVLGGQDPRAAFGPLRHVARIGFVRRLPARLVGVGVLPEHVRTPRVTAPAGGSATTIEVVDRGWPIAFSFEDVLSYHGRGSPGGAAHAFKVLERALPLLDPDGPCERREIVVGTAFEGPGARDAFELVTRAVTGGRFHIDAALARPERGPTLERFVFWLGYRDRQVTLTACEGSVPDELIELARTQERSVDQERRLDVLKQAMADHAMGRPASEVYEAVEA